MEPSASWLYSVVNIAVSVLMLIVIILGPFEFGIQWKSNRIVVIFLLWLNKKLGCHWCSLFLWKPENEMIMYKRLTSRFIYENLCQRYYEVIEVLMKYKNIIFIYKKEMYMYTLVAWVVQMWMKKDINFFLLNSSLVNACFNQYILNMYSWAGKDFFHGNLWN